MNEFPSFEHVVDRLRELAEIADIDPTCPVVELDVESLDLLEWVYDIADEYELEVDETIFDGAAEMTLVDLYERVRGRSATSV